MWTHKSKAKQASGEYNPNSQRLSEIARLQATIPSPPLPLQAPLNTENGEVSPEQRYANLVEAMKTDDAKCRRELKYANGALRLANQYHTMGHDQEAGALEQAAELIMRAYREAREIAETVKVKPQHSEQPYDIHATARRTVELWTGASRHIADRISRGYKEGELFVPTRSGRGGGERWLGRIIMAQLHISEDSATATVQLWEREQFVAPGTYPRPNGRVGRGIKLTRDHSECLPVVLVGADHIADGLLRKHAPTQYAEQD